MNQLSFDARMLVYDALAHQRPHVRALGGMSARVIKNRRLPLESKQFTALLNDAKNLQNDVNTLTVELDQIEKVIWELVNKMSTQQVVHSLNTELVEQLTNQRRRALLTARRRGRKPATVADSSAAAVQDQIRDLRAGFEVIRAALDDAGAPAAIGLHMRIKGLSVECAAWKKRALQAEAYERNRSREAAYSQQRQRAQTL